GHKLHNSTVSNYLAGRHSKPTDRVLEAFAAVFGVDVNRLRRAAGLPGSGEAFELPPEASRLTGPQRELIRTAVRLFVEQNDALADRAQRDGSTARVSPLRPRLVSDNVDTRVLEMPFAADEEKPGDDPGEDEH